MSKVEFHPEINKDGVAEIVKYRIRKINDWVSHRIPVSRRKVLKGQTYQNIRRWHFEDNNESVPIEQAMKLNSIDIKRRLKKAGMQ